MAETFELVFTSLDDVTLFINKLYDINQVIFKPIKNVFGIYF
jgi:hypothetical protein